MTKSGELLEKTDPFAFVWEVRPKSASLVWDINYTWEENIWISKRKKMNQLDAQFFPIGEDFFLDER